MKTLLEAIRPTTFIEAEKLATHLGLELTIATETFQHTGSFKFRAGYNVALNVPNEELFTASSGNFGQGLALACMLLGKKCTVVMPDTSARVKIDAVAGYGATVDLIDVHKISRSERIAEIAAEKTGAYFASAYDDPLVIEGNASLGDELANCGKEFDLIIAPIGGGGLTSGIITGLRRNGKETPVYAAEPLLGNDAALSFRAGEIIKNEQEPATLADGARTLSIGEHNWKILQHGLADVVEVSEEKLVEAVRLYFSLANLKVEPTGALSLGAILEKPEMFAGKKICLVVSGGNVDAAVYGKLVA
jgi:threonine dehydratase